MIDTDRPMQHLLADLKQALSALRPGETLTFTVPDPDLCPGCYAGEYFEYAGHTYRHHSWHSWSTLAHLLGCRLLTPRTTTPPLVEVRFQKLDSEASFHQASKVQSREGTHKGSPYNLRSTDNQQPSTIDHPSSTNTPPSKPEPRTPNPERNTPQTINHQPLTIHHPPSTKYRPTGIFSRIDKREEPDFLYHYLQALDEVKIEARKRILDLGVYRGDEFRVILERLGGEEIPDMIGIDHDIDAIAYAQAHIPEATFHLHDINGLASLDPGRFDLLISIGTLQSPGIETKPLVMELVQHHLTDDGAIIFGWPNSRWIDGELIQGAKAPNYPFSELSLLIKDLHWIKKYLQQHRFRVRIFGQSYLFLVATKISKPNRV
jgi:2-polyprenyl-3-methyl-5-hydroxy-6-metoxy-1,4-benzoquinol methylase